MAWWMDERHRRGGYIAVDVVCAFYTLFWNYTRVMAMRTNSWSSERIQNGRWSKTDSEGRDEAIARDDSCLLTNLEISQRRPSILNQCTILLKICFENASQGDRNLPDMNVLIDPKRVCFTSGPPKGSPDSNKFILQDNSRGNSAVSNPRTEAEPKTYT